MGANVAVAQNAHEAFYMYWYRVPSCDNVYLIGTNDTFTIQEFQRGLSNI